MSVPVDGATETSLALHRIATEHALAPLGKRPNLLVYLRQVRRRLPFAVELARSRFRAENEADRLGSAWIVLRPLITAAVYGFVFSLLLSGGRPANYVGFLVIGVFLFQYFSSCLTEGSRAIIANMGLVTTLHFPRALLPIAVVVQQTLALGPMVAVMALVVLVSKLATHSGGITVEWLLVVPVLTLMALFNTGVTFFAARLTIHMRDVAQLIPFMTRILFYLSGVIWPVSKMADGQSLIRQVLTDNPLNIFIEMTRSCLLYGKVPSLHDWAWAAGWAAVVVVAGFTWFWRAEELYGRE